MYLEENDIDDEEENDYNELKCELSYLKCELYDIKNMIKKLAIYEFDD